MPPNPYRITTRRLMALVAIIALAFAGLRCHAEFGYSTLSYGRHTSVLPIGTPVVAIEPIRAGHLTLDAGIPCTVTADPPDEDSAYPYRLVGISIDAGPHRGTVISVRRTLLRVDDWLSRP